MRALALALALAACATPVERGPIALDALIADARAYVTQRYRPNELPAALIADLTAAGFQCQDRASGSECGRADPAFATCFDVYTVQIDAAVVRAEMNRRCLGGRP